MKKATASAGIKLESKASFSNIEIITLAMYLLGGDSHNVDTEDVAIKVNQLAPGRFTWVKYPDQINIHIVKTHLWDSKSERKGCLVTGSDREGWILSSAGLHLAKLRLNDLKAVDVARKQVSAQEKQWRRSERTRISATEAFTKFQAGNADGITRHEAEAFFRLNDYVIGQARERKIHRIESAFGEDPELGAVVRALIQRLQAE